MWHIDLNADVGESFGHYTIGADVDIFSFITSANIACGFHAGDPHVLNQAVKLAVQNGVSIGAHPGLPDIQGFGRRWIPYTASEIYELVVYQIGAMQAFTKIHGVPLHHVKPHGALYNQAAISADMAMAVAQAIRDVDTQLILYGLAGSELIVAGEKVGLAVAQEVFADRNYEEDGTLTPRTHPDALIEEDKQVIERLIFMITKGKIKARTGQELTVNVDTVCVHGDGARAVSLLSSLQKQLIHNEITVAAI